MEMKRILPILVLLLMLVILPLGSYIYLKDGVDYRKAALAKVKAKGELISFDYYDNGQLKNSKQLKGTTTLLQVNNGSTQDSMVSLIYEQFNKSPNLKMMSLNSDSMAMSMTDIENFYSPMYYVVANTYAGKDIILVDTGLQVRSYYELNDSTLNELVRDIAVVLPLKKKSTIKMTDR